MLQKTIVLIIFQLLTQIVAAQTLGASTTNSGGSAGAKQIFSIGEIYVEPISLQAGGSGFVAVLGELVLSDAESPAAADFHLKMLPNPTSSLLRLETDATAEIFHFWLLDAAGRQLRSGQIAPSGSLDLQSETSGVFWVLISNQKSQPLKLFKIIKK